MNNPEKEIKKFFTYLEYLKFERKNNVFEKKIIKEDGVEREIYVINKENEIKNIIYSKKLNLTERERKLLLEERGIVTDFFRQVVDIVPLMNEDHIRIRSFLIDWYSALRTKITISRRSLDPYQMGEDELNDLILSFGFPYPEYIRRDMKAQFIHDLVNFYKFKGSVSVLGNVLIYCGFASFFISEWWLKRSGEINSENGEVNIFNDFMVESVPVWPEDVDPNDRLNIMTYRMQEFLTDPHWRITFEELSYLFGKTDIKLPSILPYISLSFVGDTNILECYSSLFNRILANNLKYYFTHACSFIFSDITNQSEKEKRTLYLENSKIGNYKTFLGNNNSNDFSRPYLLKSFLPETYFSFKNISSSPVWEESLTDYLFLLYRDFNFSDLKEFSISFFEAYLAFMFLNKIIMVNEALYVDKLDNMDDYYNYIYESIINYGDVVYTINLNLNKTKIVNIEEHGEEVKELNYNILSLYGNTNNFYSLDNEYIKVNKHPIYYYNSEDLNLVLNNYDWQLTEAEEEFLNKKSLFYNGISIPIEYTFDNYYNTKFNDSSFFLKNINTIYDNLVDINPKRIEKEYIKYVDRKNYYKDNPFKEFLLDIPNDLNKNIYDTIRKRRDRQYIDFLKYFYASKKNIIDKEVFHINLISRYDFGETSLSEGDVEVNVQKNKNKVIFYFRKNNLLNPSVSKKFYFYYPSLTNTSLRTYLSGKFNISFYVDEDKKDDNPNTPPLIKKIKIHGLFFNSSNPDEEEKVTLRILNFFENDFDYDINFSVDTCSEEIMSQFSSNSVSENICLGGIEIELFPNLDDYEFNYGSNKNVSISEFNVYYEGYPKYEHGNSISHNESLSLSNYIHLGNISKDIYSPSSPFSSTTHLFGFKNYSIVGDNLRIFNIVNQKNTMSYKSIIFINKLLEENHDIKRIYFCYSLRNENNESIIPISELNISSGYNELFFKYFKPMMIIKFDDFDDVLNKNEFKILVDYSKVDAILIEYNNSKTDPSFPLVDAWPNYTPGRYGIKLYPNNYEFYSALLPESYVMDPAYNLKFFNYEFFLALIDKINSFLMLSKKEKDLEFRKYVLNLSREFALFAEEKYGLKNINLMLIMYTGLNIKDLKKIIDFFKPIRVRLKNIISKIFFNSPSEDTVCLDNLYLHPYAKKLLFDYNKQPVDDPYFKIKMIAESGIYRYGQIVYPEAAYNPVIPGDWGYVLDGYNRGLADIFLVLYLKKVFVDDYSIVYGENVKKLPLDNVLRVWLLNVKEYFYKTDFIENNNGITRDDMSLKLSLNIREYIKNIYYLYNIFENKLDRFEIPDEESYRSGDIYFDGALQSRFDDVVIKVRPVINNYDQTIPQENRKEIITLKGQLKPNWVKVRSYPPVLLESIDSTSAYVYGPLHMDFSGSEVYSIYLQNNFFGVDPSDGKVKTLPENGVNNRILIFPVTEKIYIENNNIHFYGYLTGFIRIKLVIEVSIAPVVIFIGEESEVIAQNPNSGKINDLVNKSIVLNTTGTHTVFIEPESPDEYFRCGFFALLIFPAYNETTQTFDYCKFKIKDFEVYKLSYDNLDENYEFNI